MCFLNSYLNVSVVSILSNWTVNNNIFTSAFKALNCRCKKPPTLFTSFALFGFLQHNCEKCERIDSKPSSIILNSFLSFSVNRSLFFRHQSGQWVTAYLFHWFAMNEKQHLITFTYRNSSEMFRIATRPLPDSKQKFITYKRNNNVRPAGKIVIYCFCHRATL